VREQESAGSSLGRFVVKGGRVRARGSCDASDHSQDNKDAHGCENKPAAALHVALSKVSCQEVVQSAISFEMFTAATAVGATIGGMEQQLQLQALVGFFDDTTTVMTL